MGMSTVVAFTLIFIGMMVLFSGAIITYQNAVSTQTTAMRDEVDLQYSKTHARLNITSEGGVRWEYLFVTVENSGSVAMEAVDLYVNGELVQRNDSNRTVAAVLELGSADLFDPGEVWNITYYGNFSVGSHIVKVIGSYGPSDSSSVALGYEPGIETLSITSGVWSPASPGPALNASELFAINNDGDTALLLDALGEDNIGLSVENPSDFPQNVTKVHIIVDYDAPGLDGFTFRVEGRDGTYDGVLFCFGVYNASTGEETVTLDCDDQHEFSGEDLENLYVNAINNDAAFNVSIDWIRIETDYSY